MTTGDSGSDKKEAAPAAPPEVKAPAAVPVAAVEAKLPEGPPEDRIAYETLKLLLAPLQGAIKALGQVATGAALFLGAMGVVVAGSHYARAGVPIGSLPLLLVTGGAIGFVVLTLFALFLGMTVGLGRSMKRRALLLALGTSTLLAVFAVNFSWTLGLLGYLFLPFSIGLQWGLPTKPSATTTTGPSTGQLFSFASGLFYPVVLAGIYGTWVYPTVPPELGGGRPKLVRITWQPTAPPLPSGSVYEVFRDTSLVYLAIETGSSSRVFLRSASAKFIAVPTAQIRAIEYLPWALPEDVAGASAPAPAQSPSSDAGAPPPGDGGAIAPPGADGGSAQSVVAEDADAASVPLP